LLRPTVGLLVAVDDPPAGQVVRREFDDDPDWRLLAPGELLVADGVKCSSLFPFDEPAKPLRMQDLTSNEATAQEPLRP